MRNRNGRIAAAWLTAVMTAMTVFPAFAGSSRVSLSEVGTVSVNRESDLEEIIDEDVFYDEDFIEEERETDFSTSFDRNGRKVDFATSSNAEVQVDYLIDGDRNADKISFYMKRDPNTNEAPLPEPVELTIEQISGPAVGPVMATVSENLNRSKRRVTVIPKEGTDLSVGHPVTFVVSFVDKDVADGKEDVFNDLSENYIQISGNDIGGRIPVVYGADGLFLFYSAEFAELWKGELIEDGEMLFANVGEIDLNSMTVPSFTLCHKFTVFPGMPESDLHIVKAALDPEGLFTFADGSTEMEPSMDSDNIISIPIKMKAEAFREMKNEASQYHRELDFYRILAELVVEYSDGYLAGGKAGIMPLVYHVTYTPVSTGGSGGGGGGGSSSGSAISSGAVVGPGLTPRETKSAAEDIGWVQKDGAWYYMDGQNKPVTDWLLGPDGRWYFLDKAGVMKTGWLQIGSTWYFLNADGAMAVGWVQGADGKWYYLQANGAMAAEVTTPDGYYVDKDGVWVQQ